MKTIKNGIADKQGIRYSLNPVTAFGIRKVNIKTLLRKKVNIKPCPCPD